MEGMPPEGMPPGMEGMMPPGMEGMQPPLPGMEGMVPGMGEPPLVPQQNNAPGSLPPEILAILQQGRPAPLS